MNPPFSAIANVDRRMAGAALCHMSSALARLAEIANNRKSGLLLQANADPARGVDATVSGNQFIANSDYGIAVGLNRIGLRHDGNRFDRNRLGDSVDHRSGTARRLIDR